MQQKQNSSNKLQPVTTESQKIHTLTNYFVLGRAKTDDQSFIPIVKTTPDKSDGLCIPPSLRKNNT